MVLASFIAGVLVGAAAILISTTLRARMARGRERLRPWLLGAAALVAVLASVSIMYARLAPRSVVSLSAAAAALDGQHVPGSASDPSPSDRKSVV